MKTKPIHAVLAILGLLATHASAADLSLIHI